MNTKTKIKKRVTVAKDINFNHARVDPSHCFADGLFQPILHGKRAALPLDVAYKYQSVIFRWQHPTTRLCIKDQSVFVAVLRIASDKTRAIKVDLEHQDLELQKARNGLNLQLEANNLECLVITTTAREIAHTLDLKISGPAIARIHESLERLAGVSFSISHKQSEVTFWKTNMFSVVSTDGPNRLIAINPCLSKALVDVMEKLVKKLGVNVQYGGSRAYYDPTADYVRMPVRGAFPDAEAFYGTLAHEISHWSGHPSRLNRQFGRFGDEAYAREELRAELSGAFLAGETGIGSSTDSHAAYVGSWIKALKNDRREIFRAASDASKIVSFMLGRTEDGTAVVQPAADQESLQPALAASNNVVETKKRRPLREAMYPGSAKRLGTQTLGGEGFSASP